MLPDVRFMSRVFLLQPERLRHGIELVAESLGLAQADVVREIPPGGKQEREFYTVDLVVDVLRQIARSDREYESLRDSFARMLAFDALIGTNDRHAENWGVIEHVLDRTVPLRFAPIYDTARGLFWQHTDAQLVDKVNGSSRKTTIESYAHRSAPLITAGGAANNHFDVIEYVMLYRADMACSVRQVVAALSGDEIRAMMHREFRNLLSRFRLQLVDDLLMYRHGRLRSICRL